MKKIVDSKKISSAKILYSSGLSAQRVALQIGVDAKTILMWCKGIVRTRSQAQKIIGTIPPSQKGKNLGRDNVNWKGDGVGYSALHDWVERHLGKAKEKECSSCGSRINLEWANKSLEYKRDSSDWMVLCAKCHDSYDRRKGWGNATNHFNL